MSLTQNTAGNVALKKKKKRVMVLYVMRQKPSIRFLDGTLLPRNFFSAFYTSVRCLHTLGLVLMLQPLKKLFNQQGACGRSQQLRQEGGTCPYVCIIRTLKAHTHTLASHTTDKAIKAVTYDHKVTCFPFSAQVVPLIGSLHE